MSQRVAQQDCATSRPFGSCRSAVMLPTFAFTVSATLDAGFSEKVRELGSPVALRLTLVVSKKPSAAPPCPPTVIEPMPLLAVYVRLLFPSVVSVMLVGSWSMVTARSTLCGLKNWPPSETTVATIVRATSCVITMVCEFVALDVE